MRRRSGGEGVVRMKCLSLNQDASCFICGTIVGFRVYTTHPLFLLIRRENSEKQNQESENPPPPNFPQNVRPTDFPSELTTHGEWNLGGVQIAAMLYRTNVFALVTSGAQKKLRLWDDRRGHIVREFSLRKTIRNIAMGRNVLAVVTDSSVYVFECESLRCLEVLETMANPSGLVSLNCCGRDSGYLLVVPAVTPGVVRLVTSTSRCVLHAHRQSLSFLTLSPDACYIVTAGQSGTVLKVFLTESNQLIQVLHRGAQASRISSVAFTSQLIAVVAASLTLHIFHISEVPPVHHQTPGIQHSFKELLPRFLSATRSFAQFHIPSEHHFADLRAHAGESRKSGRIYGPLCVFCPSSNNQLLLIHYNGLGYSLSLRPPDVCALAATHTWLSSRPQDGGEPGIGGCEDDWEFVT